MTLRKKITGRMNQKKNKGVAMVMVIVAIAFIGMLVAMVLYMSYANYMMKSTDRLAKDNFYTAESALDIINAGLQKDISDCMAKAYVTAMQNSEKVSTTDMLSNFKKYFVDELRSTGYLGDTTDPDKYNLGHLTAMWDGVITVAASPGATGAYLSANEGQNKMLVMADNSYILLQNLHVVYTDSRGYVSIINTDIRIETPALDFAAAAGQMQIENYAIIANDSLVNDANLLGGAAATEITGNVFGGYEGITLANQSRLAFKYNPPDDEEDVSYNLAAGSINLDNALNTGTGFSTDEHYKTYVDDINVNTARISLKGQTYVSDDLDISGKRSEVTLGGSYYGYGNSDTGSQGSSSILINGADSKLDFSALETLMLSGHAYVGAMRYDADTDRQASAINAGIENDADKVTPDGLNSDKISGIDGYRENADQYDDEHADDEDVNTIPQNKSDIMMGESMSVRANQLLYLVPGDCIGYIAGTDKQVVTKNPMTYDEYIMLTETEEYVVDDDNNPIRDEFGNQKTEKKYETVRLAVLWNRLGGNIYTNDYKAVFRRINGNVMVYLYLDFTNEQTANDFYQAYYNYNPEGMANYVSSYVRELTWSDALKNADDKLTLAGNAFDYDAATKNLTLVSHNNDANHAETLLRRMNAKEDYARKYLALMHSSSEDYTRLSSTEETTDIFDNLVSETLLQELSGTYEDGATNAAAELRYFTNGEGDITYPGDCHPDTHLIVTNGDVYLNAEYRGLVLAGGSVYLRSGCNYVKYDAQVTINALRASQNVAGAERYAYEVLGQEGQATYGVLSSSSNPSDSEIKLVDLISYENWKKD